MQNQRELGAVAEIERRQPIAICHLEKTGGLGLIALQS
jgi:hypothetical protein